MDATQYVHKVIKPDGTLVDYPPKGKQYTLEELQSAVGGYIQIVHPVGDSRYLIVLNEEGKLKDLPLNKTATRLYRQPPDYIVGPALVCLDGDID